MNYQMSPGNPNAQYPQQPMQQMPSMTSSMQPGQNTSAMYPPQMPQAMSTGGTPGMAGGGDMEMAHIGKHELPDLDALQGEATYLPGTKVRHYGGLETALSGNPEFQHQMNDHVNHYARGGEIHQIRDMANHMKMSGRHGDNDVAFIGPHTRALFKHLAGGESINPHTGAPEYFSFGNMFKGLGSAASKLGSAAVKHAGNAASALGRGAQSVAAAAPGALQKLGQGASSVANKAGQFMSSPHGQNLLGGALNTGLSFLNGDSYDKALMQGANSFASQYDNPAAKFAAGASEAYNDPENGGMSNWKQNISRGIQGATGEEPQHPAARFASGVADTYTNPDQFGDMNPQQRIAHGAARASEGSSSPLAIGARTAARNIAGGRSGRRAAQQAAHAALTQANPAMINQAYGANSFDPSLFQ